jgi:hypothetical protein
MPPRVACRRRFANIGATDHMPFDEIGLPGFQFLRDYMEGANTRHP